LLNRVAAEEGLLIVEESRRGRWAFASSDCNVPTVKPNASVSCAHCWWSPRRAAPRTLKIPEWQQEP